MKLVNLLLLPGFCIIFLFGWTLYWIGEHQK